MHMLKCFSKVALSEMISCLYLKKFVES